MRNFRELTEATGTVVFTFGRFNPPTTGHEKLIKKVASVAGSNPYRIYPSHSQNPKKDPLPYTLKIAYLRKMFPRYAKSIMADKAAKTAIDIAVKLYDEGYTSLMMIAGSDRVKEFSSLLKKYNGVDNKRHGYYKFDVIDIISAGERDPDAEGVEGMSASKMRAAAAAGDFDSFKTGLPSSFKDAQKLYNDVRKYMGIREERDMGEMNDFETLRDMYLTGKLWNIGDIVEANGVEGRVIRKGTNYVAFNDSTGKVHKAWLHDIVERNYAKEYENYHSSPEQIARRSSRNKAQRMMGTIDGMDVHHKDNNPLNNDPSNLEHMDKSENRREPRLRERRVKQDPDIKKSKGTEPAKYYAKDAKGKDMAVSTKKARDTHFTKGAKMDDDNPAAYKPAPGDKGAKTKPSKHTKKFKQMYGEALGKNATVADYVDDFRKSDSPQFKGKSDKKIQKMAVAAYLDKKDKNEEFGKIREFNVPEIIKTTIHRMTHPKGYEEIVKAYVKAVAADKDKKHDTGFHLAKVAQLRGFDRTKPLVNYVNSLVKKGKLPQQLTAELDKDVDESLWANIHKKRQRIKQGSGERMRKKGEKGAPTPAQLQRAKESPQYEEIQDAYHLDEKIAGLVKKAEKSGMPYGILKKVYDRGMAAWRTGHRPGTTPQQWGMARVNSFTTKSSGTWGKADKDLASKVRGESVEMLKNAWGEITEKAEYQGKSVQLNNPTKGDVKKYKVYVRNDKGNVVKVEFGDPNMEIKRDDPARRKAFRARHNCDQKKDKTTAGYWSCKFWSGKSVTDLMKG